MAVTFRIPLKITFQAWLRTVIGYFASVEMGLFASNCVFQAIRSRITIFLKLVGVPCNHRILIFILFLEIKLGIVDGQNLPEDFMGTDENNNRYCNMGSAGKPHSPGSVRDFHLGYQGTSLLDIEDFSF